MKQNDATPKELVITRVFDAPRDLVFKAFTEEEHMKHWWGPKGFKITIFKFDLRPGGFFHYKMSSADGNEMIGKFVYYEIKAPEKIVFTNSFADKEGNITKAPFAQDWPHEIMNTWTFAEEDGKTKVTLIGRPYNATDDQIKTFEDNFGSMNQGFGGTFDQLDEYLKTIKK